jgi:hypothetical protein
LAAEKIKYDEEKARFDETEREYLPSGWGEEDDFSDDSFYDDYDVDDFHGQQYDGEEHIMGPAVARILRPGYKPPRPRYVPPPEPEGEDAPEPEGEAGQAPEAEPVGFWGKMRQDLETADFEKTS